MLGPVSCAGAFNAKRRDARLDGQEFDSTNLDPRRRCSMFRICSPGRLLRQEAKHQSIGW